MALAVTHQLVMTTPDDPAYENKPSDWNATHSIAGLGTGVETALGIAVNTTGGVPTIGATLTAGRVALVGTGGVLEDDAGLTYNTSTDLLTSGAFNASIGSASAVAYKLGGVAGTGMYSVAGASVDFACSGTSVLRAIQGTYLYLASVGNRIENATSNSSLSLGLGANQAIFGGDQTAQGAVTSRTEINKAVTAFTDGVAKATFTVTIPNAAHCATLEVEVTGICGAGGAIGAGEASATNSYKFNIVRTAGVNAVVGASAAFGAAAANVAGGTTLTATAVASAIAGAVGATNTFTVDVTITKGGGASDNHTCLIYGKLMNNAASGITIA